MAKGREKRNLQSISRTPPPPSRTTTPPSRIVTYSSRTPSTFTSVSISTSVSYTYSSRQYCSVYREYYYSRSFYCGRANTGGAVGGGVGGAVAFVIVLIIIFVIWKKKQAEKA